LNIYHYTLEPTLLAVSANYRRLQQSPELRGFRIPAYQNTQAYA